MVSTYVIDNCKCTSIIDYKRPLSEKVWTLEHSSSSAWFVLQIYRFCILLIDPWATGVIVLGVNDTLVAYNAALHML